MRDQSYKTPLRLRLAALIDRLRRRPYSVERRGDTFYIVKRDKGEIGTCDRRSEALAYAHKRNGQVT